MSQFKHAMAASTDVDWSWERLISEQHDVLAAGRSALVAQPKLAMTIPAEHRVTVLLAGSATWTSSNRVNTTSLARIFFDQLGVTMVNSSFSYYRDALLFGMMLNWGLEVQSFDLTTEQSVAAFALAQRLAVRPPPSATQTPMATDGAHEYTEAGEQTPEKSQKVCYDALTIKNAKTIRERSGATRWTQKLGKAMEHYLKAQRELPEEEYTPGQPALEMQVQIGEELAADVWSIILDCDDPGKKAPKSADKHKKKKEKLKREHHKKGKGKGPGSRKHLSDSSRSEEDSSTSPSDSSSSLSSGETPRKGASRSASASSSWSPAKPTMVIIDGKEHFREKTSNNLIDCSRPPQTKCRFCKAHHWFWEGPAYWCPGPKSK